MELYKNVQRIPQYRRHYEIDQERLEQIRDMIRRGQRPNKIQCKGLLRVVKTGEVTVTSNHESIYFRHLVVDGTVCRFLVRGELLHTACGWVAFNNTIEMIIGATRRSRSTYDIYPEHAPEIITPRCVLQALMNDPTPHVGPRTVCQAAVSGEHFLHELFSELFEFRDSNLTSEQRLRDVEEDVVGPTMLTSTLDSLGLEGTPLAFHDPVELGHGRPEDLLKQYFPDLMVEENWRCIRTRQDNLQWHGSRVTPYTARSSEHRQQLITDLSKLVTPLL